MRRRYTYFNAAAEQITGLSRNEVIDRNHWELFPETRGTLIESEYLRVVRDHVPVEFDVWYERWQRWYSVRAYPTRDGGLSACFFDITQRKRTVEMLDKGARFGHLSRFLNRLYEVRTPKAW